MGQDTTPDPVSLLNSDEFIVLEFMEGRGTLRFPTEKLNFIEFVILTHILA